jgi:hypothetical protein
MTERIRVDMADLTLGELADVSELLDGGLSDTLTGAQQPRAIAAIVCVVQRRTNPDYTLDQALALKMSDLEIVNADAEGEALAAGNGGAPVSSPASGG